MKTEVQIEWTVARGINQLQGLVGKPVGQVIPRLARRQSGHVTKIAPGIRAAER